jgi:hypothetical protein
MKRSRSTLRVALTAACVLGAAVPCLATTINWIVDQDGLWNVPANWDFGVPGQNDKAVINRPYAITFDIDFDQDGFPWEVDEFEVGTSGEGGELLLGKAAGLEDQTGVNFLNGAESLAEVNDFVIRLGPWDWLVIGNALTAEDINYEAGITNFEIDMAGVVASAVLTMPGTFGPGRMTAVRGLIGVGFRREPGDLGMVVIGDPAEGKIDSGVTGLVVKPEPGQKNDSQWTLAGGTHLFAKRCENLDYWLVERIDSRHQEIKITEFFEAKWMEFEGLYAVVDGDLFQIDVRDDLLTVDPDDDIGLHIAQRLEVRSTNPCSEAGPEVTTENLLVRENAVLSLDGATRFNLINPDIGGGSPCFAGAAQFKDGARLEYGDDAYSSELGTRHPNWMDMRDPQGEWSGGSTLSAPFAFVPG